MLLSGTLAGIFNNCVDKPGKNSYGEKQSKSTFPRYLFPVGHVLENGDKKPCNPGDVRGCLQDLPQGGLESDCQIGRGAQVEQQVRRSGQIKRYFFFHIFSMNTLDTLCFPDTVLPWHQQLPLALFFTTLHVLQPIEEGEKIEQDTPSSPKSHTFMEMGFCQVHTPSELGTDRDRFLHLLHDIKNRKDNYVEQLSYLSLASLSAVSGGGDTSKQAILSTLLQGMDKKSSAQSEQERQELWQARLVLKIAEMLDQEEEELALQLATIDDQEIDLFRNLQGEIRESGDGEEVPEDPFQELLELRQKMNQPRPGMVKNRLRAWSRLMLSGDVPHFPLWTTRRQEAAEILLDQYEKEHAAVPLRLLSLELPVRFDGDAEDEWQRVSAFRTRMQGQLQELATCLDELTGRQLLPPGDDPAVLAPWAEAWREQWDEQVESSFPASEYGRQGLTLYLLPGMSLLSIVGGEPDELQNGLLAVCG